MKGSIIQHQLDNFHYREALELISEYGDSAFAGKYAAMKQSSFTEKKVIQHLEEWIGRCEHEPDQPSEAANHPTGIGSKPDLSVSDDPHVKELILSKNVLVRQRDHLRGQLELIPSNNERKKTAEEIMKLTDEIAQHWDDINALEAGKELPKEEPKDQLEKIFEGVSDPVQLEKIRNNHISYRSKAKKGKRPKELMEFYELVIKEAERRQREPV